MPAKDRYHDVVKRALVKAGWVVTDENYFIATQHRQFWIDLVAESSPQQSRAFVEVKSFLPDQSSVENLANALGKYLICSAAIQILRSAVPIYLAVPQYTYQGMLTEDIGLQLRHQTHLRVIVFEPVQAVIPQWIP